MCWSSQFEMNKFFEKNSFEPPVSSFCTFPSILTEYSSIPHSWIQWSLNPLSSRFKTFFHVFFFPIKIERHPETQIIYSYWLLIDYMLTYLWICSMKWRESHSVMSDSVRPHVLYYVHGILQARILEWVAIPFSRGSSQPRDQTQVSRIAGGFFTSWATREAQEYWSG